jgi:hypothetical protein
LFGLTLISVKKWDDAHSDPRISWSRDEGTAKTEGETAWEAHGLLLTRDDGLEWRQLHPELKNRSITSPEASCREIEIDGHFILACYKQFLL